MSAPRLINGFNSYPGQAHFAGTGPAGSACWQCRSWSGKHDPRNVLKSGQPARCEKYRELTRRAGDTVPPTAAACRYFVDRATPQRAA